MFCSQCGKEIPDDSVFCPECGKKVGNVSVQNNQIKAKKKIKKPILLVLAVLLVGVVFSQINNKENVKISSERREKPDGTVWSTDYLFWYVEDLDKDINRHIKEAKKILEKSEEMKNVTYLKFDDGLFGNGAYEISSEQSEYCYEGEIKDNQPSGFGILYKYYFMDTDIETYIPIYMGNFENGKYSGSGISFYDYSEDNNIVSSIAYSFSLNENNLQEIIVLLIS